MADMLANGAAWLAGQLKAAAGTTVTYVRGNQASEVTATIGASAFESANQSGVLERWESRDYLIAVQDLPFGNPVRGDLITEDVGGLLLEYEVASPRGVPEWHPADAFGVMVRVHTIQTDAGLTYLVTEAGDQLATEADELIVV